jgi:DMSO/TMAO reductase YedYZ heme-binding membrane subunit
MEDLKTSDVAYCIIGGISGLIAYLRAEMLLQIHFDDVAAKIGSLLWAVLVAIATTSAGYVTKKILDKYWPRLKRYFKRKIK